MDYFFGVSTSAPEADPDYAGKTLVKVKTSWGVLDDAGVAFVDEFTITRWRFTSGGRFPAFEPFIAPVIKDLQAAIASHNLVVSDADGTDEHGWNGRVYASGPIDEDGLVVFEGAFLDVTTVVMRNAYRAAGARIRKLREAGEATDPKGAE